MENVFLHLLNMSLTAAVLVVVVLLLRLVFHKAPRWIHCLLWALVAVRLLCPFAIESDLSLMPSTPVVTVPNNVTLSDSVIPSTPSVDVIVPDTPTTSVPPQTNVGGTVTTPVTPTLPDSSVADTGDSVDPWQVALSVATQVWLLGALALLIYAVVSTVRLRLQVRESVCMRDNIWQCDHLRSPFILGVLRPRIYLPSDLDAAAQASVIAHEKAHLRRLDHLWKPLGFLLLAVYWFNPLLWVAYIFLCRDIEAACDEQVVRDMTAADRKAYSEALLACSAPRRLVSACPLAFGETSVKSRIKSVLSYKKPAIWIIVAALLVSTVAGVCLLTDRPVAEQEADAPPSVTDGDDDPDTAPLGLTHVMRSGLGTEDLKQYFGSEGVQRFDSREELLAFLTPHQEGDQEWLGVQWEVGDFDQFDDAFFADNYLLLTHHTTASGMFTPEVVGYTYSEDGTVLTVEFVEYQPGFVTDDIGEWLMFSGIKKADLEGVTELKAHWSRGIPTDSYAAAFVEPTEYPDKATEKWREFYDYWDEVYLRAMLIRLNGGEWVEDSSAIDRALNFVGCVWIDGDVYYVTHQFDAVMSTDGKVGWLTTEESVRVSWLFDEKEHPSYAFIGKVKKVEGDNVLMECLEGEWLTGDVWVDFSHFDKVRVGETFKITYDYLEPTDPPRVTPINVMLASVGGTTTSTPTGSTTQPTTTPTTPPSDSDVTKTAVVVFNYTNQNNLNDRQIEELFGASSVVSIDSLDALKAFHKTYTNLGLAIYAEDDNAAFFEEYALLLTYHETGSSMARPRAAVYTYSADGTVLSVAVDEFWPNSGLVTDDIGEWIITSVIKKADLEGVAELTSHFRAQVPESSISFLVNPASDPRNSAEKWSKAIADKEADVLYRILISAMIDEEWGRWTFPSNVQFDMKLVLNGDTFYYDIDSGMVIATEGKTVPVMFWTSCFGKLAARTNMIEWVLARYSDTNDEVWLWENFDSDYQTKDIRLLNTSEMRSIALRTNWVANSSRNRNYDAQYTIGGVLYLIDMKREEVLTADKKQVSPLTKEEVAYLNSVLGTE